MSRSDRGLVPRRVSRWVMAVGIAGTVLLAMGAFSLSFTALMHLADRSGVNPVQAWEWPLIVDGVIVVATVSVVALSGRKGTGYAWLLLVCAALVSVGGNVAQAVRLSTEEPTWIAASVATIPPLVLLAATHMTVILTRPAGEPGMVDAPVVVPAGELAGTTPVASQIPGTPPAPRLRRSPVIGETPSTWKVAEAQRLRAEGLSTVLIAEQLGVSTGSVRRYLKPSPVEQTGVEL